MTEQRPGQRRHSWAEPYKIKMVEPLRMTTRAEREAALTEAGWNTFLLRSRDVYIDLLTDSGTNAMSQEQWAALMLGDEAYAGSESFYRFERAVQDVYGYPFMVPTHQGRGAEHIISQVLISGGDVVPGNMYFTTTRLHQELAGGTFVDIIIDEAHDPASEHPFKGDVDLAKLRRVIAEYGRERIPYVSIAVTVNMAGGQPDEPGEHRRGPRPVPGAWHPAVLRHHPDRRERVVHPPARAGVRRRPGRRDRASHLRPHRRGVDERQEGRAGQHRRVPGPARPRRVRGGAQPVRRLRGPAHLRRAGRARHGGDRPGLHESVDQAHLDARIGQVIYLGEQLRREGVPIVLPIGGHAVFLDAAGFLPHIPQVEFPGQRLAGEIYLEAGVRTMERGIVSAGRDPETGDHRHPRLELVRITIPRRVYTQAHMDVTAEAVLSVWDRRDSVRGLEMVFEPKYLRFFQARFRPL